MAICSDWTQLMATFRSIVFSFISLFGWRSALIGHSLWPPFGSVVFSCSSLFGWLCALIGRSLWPPFWKHRVLLYLPVRMAMCSGWTQLMATFRSIVFSSLCLKRPKFIFTMGIRDRVCVIYNKCLSSFYTIYLNIWAR